MDPIRAARERARTRARRRARAWLRAKSADERSVEDGDGGEDEDEDGDEETVSGTADTCPTWLPSKSMQTPKGVVHLRHDELRERKWERGTPTSVPTLLFIPTVGSTVGLVLCCPSARVRVLTGTT